MKKLRVILIALATVCYSLGITVEAAEQGRGLQPLKNPIPTPKISFFDGKKPIELAAFKGRYLLVNFWATWCSPCVSEMPSLDRLAKKLAMENITIVAISEDEGGVSQVRPFVEKLQLNKLKILYDTSKKAFRDFGLRGLPTTYLINPDGMVVSTLEGSAVWDTGFIYDQIINELRGQKK